MMNSIKPIKSFQIKKSLKSLGSWAKLTMFSIQTKIKISDVCILTFSCFIYPNSIFLDVLPLTFIPQIYRSTPLLAIIAKQV